MALDSKVNVHPELIKSYDDDHEFWCFDNVTDDDVVWLLNDAIDWQKKYASDFPQLWEELDAFIEACNYELDYRISQQSVRSYTSLDMLADAAWWSSVDHTGVAESCLMALMNELELILYTHAYDHGLGEDEQLYERLLSKKLKLQEAVTPRWKRVGARQLILYKVYKESPNPDSVLYC